MKMTKLAQQATTHDILFHSIIVFYTVYKLAPAMYSFKLCFNSTVFPQIRRIVGDATEVSSYSKLVEFCYSLYPSIVQSNARKVLIKYVDNEGDEISAD